ncbi:DUF5320 domain-containing protein [Oligosphaera ethanolica]|nr:DUF5320 domain-containing protein [Oligosphaera ethanolica]
MPRGNGTGPMGMGPMTGRGAGYCAGFAAPGYMNPQVGGRGMGGGFGRGLGGGFGCGAGFGFGRGFGRGAAAWGVPVAPAAPLAPDQERTVLRNQLAGLEQTVADLRQRLTELEDGSAENK